MSAGDSDLTLSVGGLPPFSARGCRQTLSPIQNGELRRTINGELVYTGHPTHEKFKSVVSCQDKAPIAFDNLWRGIQVRVGCIQTLCQKITGSRANLSRDPVPGSIVIHDQHHGLVPNWSIEGRQLVFKESSLTPKYVHYCPFLDMRVVDLDYATDEWGLKVEWRLALEEV